MRTCPACGEDTEAGYAEACTKCGFSPAGEASTNGADPPPPDVAPVPEIADQPESAGTRKRTTTARIVLWLVVVAGLFGLWQYGLFDQPTGPASDQVESEIASSAQQFDASVTVDCPEDTEDTPVGDTFTCTASNDRGRTAEIEVTNGESNFEWNTGPLSTLGG